MRHHGIAAVGLIAALAMVLGGCGFFKPALKTRQSDEMLQPQAVGQDKVETIDDLFAEVVRRVPAFGGMFFDENDNSILYVYLLNPEQKVEAERAIAKVFGLERVPRGRIQVLQGQYSFLELKQWHDRLIDVLVIPGVTLTDIDDAKNRLTIGLEKMDMRTLRILEQELANLGIPLEVVNFEETGPVEFASHTLQSPVRPVVGGLRITFINSYGSDECTLGFNAIRAGVNGFVTNSHCTHPRRMGIVDNTVFHQPVISGITNRVGVETNDPPFFSFPACPTGRRCRYSDSAFAQYDGGVSFDRGYIARTTGLGSITIDHAFPTFRIVAETTSIILGDNPINKIGKTTGWTQGPIVAVCQNVNLGWTADLTLLCQHRVRANAAGGDSGSPVFKITNSPNPRDVILYGILWGRRQAYPWDPVEFWFSAIFDVESSYSELGPLTTCASGFSC